MFDLLLLGRLRVDKDQTWWEGRGPMPKGAKAIGFHLSSVSVGESHGWNPIGKALFSP